MEVVSVLLEIAHAANRFYRISNQVRGTFQNSDAVLIDSTHSPSKVTRHRLPYRGGEEHGNFDLKNGATRRAAETDLQLAARKIFPG